MNRRRLLLGSGRFARVITVIMGLLSITSNAPYADAQEAKPEGVNVVVSFGDGLTWTYENIDYKQGMTVLDAMNAVKLRKHHALDFAYNGRGQNAFLNSLAGMENEGGGRTSKNWFYRINDKLGNKSFAIAELQAGDTVLWHFGKYEP